MSVILPMETNHEVLVVGDIVFPSSSSSNVTPINLSVYSSRDKLNSQTVVQHTISNNGSFILQLPTEWAKFRILYLHLNNACNKQSFVIVPNYSNNTLNLGTVTIKESICATPFPQLNKIGRQGRQLANRLASIEGQVVLTAYFFLLFVFACLHSYYPRRFGSCKPKPYYKLLPEAKRRAENKINQMNDPLCWECPFN